MYSELKEISLVGMSNSELFQVKKDPEVIEFNILLRSTLEISSDGCLIASSSSEDYHHLLHHPQRPRQLKQEVEKEEAEDEEEKKDGKCEGGVSSTSSFSDEEVIKMRGAAARTRTRTRTLGGELEVDKDDDGFRTPTSLDHRIPVIRQCPPAPRKPKSSPKRKASSSSRRQLFLLDLSQEIGSLFPPALLDDLGRKIKKVRGGDDDTK